MIVDRVQRWRDRRAAYRPAGETIDVRRYEVASIADDTTAKRFVLGHHYSGSYPAAKFRFGIFRAGALEGVAVFSIPAQPRCLSCLPDPTASVELGRLVLLDEVPGNAESWFLARCFERLREESIVGIVSFSDPVARTDAEGNRVFAGHVGTIYQATNGCYLGRSKPDTHRLLPDGTVFHRRSMSKIRNRERGWQYAVDLLVRHGARAPRGLSELPAWLDVWLPRLTRPLRHAGNHKYAWTLQRRDRRHLPKSLPYPKISLG